MKSICDIIVFKTPFEDKKDFLDKFKKIKEMFEDYITNSGIPLYLYRYSNNIYDIYDFKNEELWIDIDFSFKKDLDNDIFFPAIIVDYKMNESNFLKENIESFLNDNIKFIFNVFWSDFFVEFDEEKYDIKDFNKWKKLNFDDLKKFNIEDKNSRENKNILDSMFFLHFNLIKNILNIKTSSNEIDKLLSEGHSLEWHLELYKQRQQIVKNNLIITQEKLKAQIETFLKYFD